MSSGDTQYLPQFPTADHLERPRDNLIVCPVYKDGDKVAPASGTCTIYNASNVSVAAPAVTIVDSIARATVASADLAGQAYGTGWRIEWVLSFAGDAVDTTFQQSALLVRLQLHPAIADPDLVHHRSDLKLLRPSDRQSFQREIMEAWHMMVNRLFDVGNRPNLIRSPSSLRTTHKWLSLALVFEGMTGGPNSDETFQVEADKFWKRYEKAWDDMTFEYGSEEGPVEGTDRRRRARPIVALVEQRGS